MSEQIQAATLSDVAHEAGVSLATASRVLNGSDRKVAEGYRLRVQSAADRIGYSVNTSAQAMARGTSRTAALLLSDISDPFFSSIAGGVAAAAEESGLLVTMAVTGRDSERELGLVRALRGLRPQVVILVGSRSVDETNRENLIRELEGVRTAGGRVVVVGQNEFPFPAVHIDDFAGAASLAAALVALGYRRFAVLAGPERLEVAGARLRGFLHGLSAADITADTHRIYHGEFTRDGGYSAASLLLKHGIEEIDALFAVNDVMAVGALTALRAAAVALPATLAVAGFDDIPSSLDSAPSLTTVRIPLDELGRRAIEVALGDSDTSVVLPTEIMIRESTPRVTPP